MRDVVAGFWTSLCSIPEGMAYAQLAGVKPVYRLYTGMMSTGTILVLRTLTSAIALSIGSVLSTAVIDGNKNPSAIFTVTLRACQSPRPSPSFWRS